jgi:hypothetical protein
MIHINCDLERSKPPNPPDEDEGEIHKPKKGTTIHCRYTVRSWEILKEWLDI